MSGFAGVFGFTGQLDATSRTRSMEAGMRGDGPAECIASGDERFAVSTRALTAEAPHRVQHAVTIEAGRIVAADVRLDNRDALLRMLESEVRAMRRVEYKGRAMAAGQAVPGTKNGEQRVSDATLLLAAYERWGTDCPEHLVGDFAFVLWDETKRRLFGARDHVGSRSFFYHVQAGRFIAFASELRPLFTLGDVPRRIDNERVADFLAGIHLDAASTFYDEISRLPPAHTLTVTPERVQVDAYWQITPRPERRYDSEAACLEAFREVFDAAVQSRMTGARPVGTFLSGGLDSSSISVTAEKANESAPALIHTFSAVYDELESCDERPYIDEVLRRGDFVPHFVSGEAQRPVTTLRKLLEVQGEPFFAPNMGVSWLLYETVRAAGVPCILHGHGGDEVISHGYGRLKELARDGAWLALARELRGTAKITGDAGWVSLLGRYAEKYALNPAAERSIVARAFRKAVHLTRRLLQRREAVSLDVGTWQDWVDAGFARRTHLQERVDAARARDPRGAQTEAERHALQLAGNKQFRALETIARTGRAHGVETSFPFWDKRLVEFCLALPSDQKLRDGWGRSILRRGMENRLPPDVQWRHDKTNFTPNLIRGMQRECSLLDDLFLNDIAVAEEYLQEPVVQDIYTRFASGGSTCSTGEIFLLWKVAVLVVWLRDVT